MRSMLRHSKGFGLGLILLMLTQLTGCKEAFVSVNAPAPDLAVFDAAEKPLNLSDYQGKPMILEFWSATCGACLVMMKKWQQVVSARPDDVAVIGVSIDKDHVDLNAFANDLGVTFPLGFDQMDITRERYQVSVTPTTFFIDQNGVVREMHIGYSEHMDLNQKINQLKTYK
ncbi:TlpA family protein disulfide reductase [Vibrio quintilis]|uniref:Thiol-disulfide oxidoreductase ResA n=1 Tax=Vibrio quintilis TaxID=1117707 RepID=A0A1M7YRI6_9VIBR|nr:TlpA disulfide reductase family protein [Vibrio quintilis]SHO55224.1 Thiol-disulfide oxidoreductase ResA [Vibrio quintilis]